MVCSILQRCAVATRASWTSVITFCCCFVLSERRAFAIETRGESKVSESVRVSSVFRLFVSLCLSFSLVSLELGTEEQHRTRASLLPTPDYWLRRETREMWFDFVVKRALGKTTAYKYIHQQEQNRQRSVSAFAPAPSPT